MAGKGAAEVGAPMTAGREGLASAWWVGAGAGRGSQPRHRPSAHRPCPQTLAAVVTALPRSSPAELTISALSLALLVPVKELNVRFRDRLPTPIPGEVVMVRMAGCPSSLVCRDPGHPIGTGRCCPLVECKEVTDRGSYTFSGLRPELSDPPESPTHTVPSLVPSRL